MFGLRANPGPTRSPPGLYSEQQPGHYRLINSGHPRYFDITPGPQSWKQYFFPATTTLFQVVRNADEWKIEEASSLIPHRHDRCTAL